MKLSQLLNLIIKIFLISLLLFILYCLTIGRDFGKLQVDKVVGMYYIHIGDKALKQHNMQDAVNAYQTGLNKFPGHYEAWLNLGNIYVAYEDFFSAAQAYESAILAKQNYTPARMNLGIITAEKLGDFDSAILQYQAIIAAKHHLITIPFVYNNKKSETANKAIAYYNMGRAYSQKAFYTPKEKKSEKRMLLGKAATAYENAVKIIKNSYDMFYNLALTYHLLGDYRKAGLNYCNAIYAEPMQYEAHYNLGLMLKHLNQEAYAIDELEKAAVLSSGHLSRNSNYIFEILNSVSMDAKIKGKDTKIPKNDKEKKKDKKKDNAPQDLEKGNIDDTEITLVNGKITPSESADAKILENFRKCNSKTLFEFN